MFKKNSFKWSALVIAIIAVIGLSYTFLNSSNSLYNVPNKPGIFESTNDQLDNNDIEFTSGWRSELIEGDRFIVVQVGSLKSDLKQGVAIVWEQNRNSGRFMSEKKYLTPSKHGAIKITDFNAFNLSVVADDGHAWIFNVFDGFREVTQ